MWHPCVPDEKETRKAMAESEAERLERWKSEGLDRRKNLAARIKSLTNYDLTAIDLGVFGKYNLGSFGLSEDQISSIVEAIAPWIDTIAQNIEYWTMPLRQMFYDNIGKPVYDNLIQPFIDLIKSWGGGAIDAVSSRLNPQEYGFKKGFLDSTAVTTSLAATLGTLGDLKSKISDLSPKISELLKAVQFTDDKPDPAKSGETIKGGITVAGETLRKDVFDTIKADLVKTYGESAENDIVAGKIADSIQTGFVNYLQQLKKVKDRSDYSTMSADDITAAVKAATLSFSPPSIDGTLIQSIKSNGAALEEATKLATLLGISVTATSKIQALAKMIKEGQLDPENHDAKFTPKELGELKTLLATNSETAKRVKSVAATLDFSTLIDIDLRPSGIRFDSKASDDGSVTAPSALWAGSDKAPASLTYK